MKNIKFSHVLTIGFALFAMFFGAGNLLLPPYIGLHVSDAWSYTTIGFMITAIILPFLGVLSVALTGDSFNDLGEKVNKNIGIVLGVIIMIGIGPLIAIPRTAATTHEVGVLPLFPSVNAVVTSVIYFGLVTYFALSSSKVVDLIGNYLTPVLILILGVLITVGLMGPVDTDLVHRMSNAEAFTLGFEEGYQTLDVMASVIFAGIIITATKLKGYNNPKEKTRVVVAAGFISSFFLLFIYGGLVYLGATSGYEWSESTTRAPLLLHIALSHLGEYGTIAMSVCISLACLTTAVAITSAVAIFFADLFKGAVSYKVLVVICSVFSCLLSITGVDNIITYAYPFLAFVYPIVITLVLYIVIFGRKIQGKLPFIGAILGTTLVSIVGLLSNFGIQMDGVNSVIQQIPLAQFDLAWVLPSIVFFVIFYFIDKSQKTENA